MVWDQISRSESVLIDNIRNILYNIAHLFGRYLANVAELQKVLRGILIAFIQGVFSNSEFTKNSAQQLGLLA
jgi:hypothetical protein